MGIIQYKKKHKHNNKNRSTLNNYLSNLQFGLYGIKAIESGVLLVQEIETIRRVISRITKRVTNVFIRVFFYHPITKKSLKSRMGKGVGLIKF